MHKKGALDVAQITLSVTEKPCYTNSALDADNVNVHLSGNHERSVQIEVSIGSSSGLLKAVRFGSYANYPVTARPNLTASRIIGLISSHQPKSIMWR